MTQKHLDYILGALNEGHGEEPPITKKELEEVERIPVQALLDIPDEWEFDVEDTYDPTMLDASVPPTYKGPVVEHEGKLYIHGGGFVFPGHAYFFRLSKREA